MVRGSYVNAQSALLQAQKFIISESQNAQSACGRATVPNTQNLQPPNNMLNDLNANVEFQFGCVMTSELMAQCSYIQEVNSSMHYTMHHFKIYY